MYGSSMTFRHTVGELFAEVIGQVFQVELADAVGTAHAHKQVVVR